MYINPFLAGILATLGVEVVIVIIIAIITTWGNKK